MQNGTDARRTRARRVFVRIAATIRHGGHAQAVKLVNLSEGGAGIELGGPLVRGAELELDFRLPRIVEPVKLTARVMWAAASANETWDVGLRFETDSAAREVVRRFLDGFRARVVVIGAQVDPGWADELRELCELEAQTFDTLDTALAGGLVSLVLVDGGLQQVQQVLGATETFGLPVLSLVGEAPGEPLDELVRRTPRLLVHRRTTAGMLFAELRRALTSHALELENERLAFELECATAPVRSAHERIESGTPLRLSGVIGTSEPMQAVYAQLEQVSRVDAPVVLFGETGTGKGLLAKVIHELSPRSRRPIVTQNCAAVSESLLDSELFGHVRGAFTGAVGDRPGLFEVADGGTIFLDEIAEMSAAMQAKLLQVLQDGELRRVGATSSTRVDVRVLCATHADLELLVEQRRFREDLYYRLVSFVVRLPPLRERVADIGPLARHFLLQFATRNRLPVRRFTADAERALEAGQWPGNVRQLQHAVERMALMAPGDFIEQPVVAALIEAGGRRSLKGPLDGALSGHERSMIRAALDRADGVIADAARALGMERSTLSRRMKKLGLRVRE